MVPRENCVLRVPHSLSKRWRGEGLAVGRRQIKETPLLQHLSDRPFILALLQPFSWCLPQGNPSKPYIADVLQKRVSSSVKSLLCGQRMGRAVDLDDEQRLGLKKRQVNGGEIVDPFAATAATTTTVATCFIVRADDDIYLEAAMKRRVAYMILLRQQPLDLLASCSFYPWLTIHRRHQTPTADAFPQACDAPR